MKHDLDFVEDVNQAIEPLQSNQYRCASCAGVFDKGWTDEEARAEQATNGWAALAEDDVAVVCDDCYLKLMGGAA